MLLARLLTEATINCRAKPLALTALTLTMKRRASTKVKKEKHPTDSKNGTPLATTIDEADKPKKGRARRKQSTINGEEKSDFRKSQTEAVQAGVKMNQKNVRMRKNLDQIKSLTDFPEQKATTRKRKVSSNSSAKEEISQKILSGVKAEDLKAEPPSKKKMSVGLRSKPLSTVNPSAGEETNNSKDVKPDNKTMVKIEKPLSVGRKFVGGHTSIAGGLQNSIIQATEMGGTAFAMFVRSQRKWNCKPMEDAAAEKFRATLVEHEFSPYSVLPHGSYLLNCGAPNAETLAKSRAGLVDELQRCEKLGLVLYNFHPGSTCGQISVDECLDKIAESINKAHKETKYIITVVENMSRQGHTIGGDFQELKGIIDRVQDKSRVGVCIDTCHAFAAGYDLASEKGFNQMMEEFEKYVGFQYLKALHLNDSKGKVGCHKDRHENIGKGFIGIEGFRRIMNEPRFNDMPMILETPWISEDIYLKEIKILNALIGT